VVVEEEETSKTKNAMEEEASKKEEASGFRTYTHWNYLAGISCRTLQHTLQHTHYIQTMELFCWNLVCLSPEIYFSLVAFEFFFPLCLNLTSLEGLVEEYILPIAVSI